VIAGCNADEVLKASLADELRSSVDAADLLERQLIAYKQQLQDQADIQSEAETN
jgi:hypothetical protein